MTRKLEKRLTDRFSFYRTELPMTESLMCFGFNCGDGWFDLIWELSEKIEKLELNQYDADESAKMLLLGESKLNVQQVKEKFGELRFYMNSTTDEMEDLIQEYCEKSGHICENCGKPGSPTESGWIKTLCKDCNKEKK